MAKTKTLGDALNMIRKHIAPLSEDGYAAEICNMAIAKIWEFYDFRETLKDLPPFYPIPGGQYYGAPAAIVPSDFLGLRQVYLCYLSSNPPAYQPLRIVKFLEDTGVQRIPADICYDPKSCSFKLFACPSYSIGTPNYIVTGVYKTKPPRVTASNYTTTLIPFDDMYFKNFIEVLKWAAYDLAGDPRAGEIATDRYGNYRASGQTAKAIAALTDMATTEGLELGDPSISPSEPLVGYSTPATSNWYL